MFEEPATYGMKLGSVVVATQEDCVRLNSQLTLFLTGEGVALD